MATPKAFSHYPGEYTQLLRQAMDNPIRVPFPNILQALRFRNHLYAFRKAIRDGTEDDGIPADLVITAPLISFKMDGTAVLVYHPKRTSNIRKALENVRGRAGSLSKDS